jgi:peptide/nickel transport system substrate-binding protein
MTRTARGVGGIIASIVLVGCGASSASSAPSGGAAPTGTLTVALPTFSGETLDPSMDSEDGRNYNGPMYDWLIGADATGKLSKDFGVLDKWVPDATGSTWTLTLKQGIKWQDGSDVTADDVAFTFKHYALQGALCISCVYLQSNLDSATATDKYTTTVKLKSPNVNFPAIIGPIEGDIKLLPGKYYTSEQAFLAKPMGSGPWKFVSRSIGQSIEYSANTDYWDKTRVPKFATLRILLVPEAATRKAILQSGGADLVAIDPRDVTEVKNGGIRIQSVQNVGTNDVLFFRSFDPAFYTHKLEFRKALALSVDWGALYNAFYTPETATPYGGGVFPFALFTAGADTSLAPYAYDLNQAKTLLGQSGYKGEEIPFYSYSFNLNPEQLDVNTAIADYWRKAGVNAKILPVDFDGVLAPKIAKEDFNPPAAIGAGGPSARPSVIGNIQVFMISPGAGGFTGAYWDRQYIDQTFADLNTTVDEAERQQKLAALNKKLYDEYWCLPIAIKNLPFGVSKRIGTWQPTAGTPKDLKYETITPAQ